MTAERWIDISTIDSPYQEQVDENSSPVQYRHRAKPLGFDGRFCDWLLPDKWTAGTAPEIRRKG